VLIPVYNEQKHLEHAATAMLGQRFDAPVEFLFIDGHSTDRSPQILAQLAQRDARVRVLDNPARGTTAALNVGLRHARGEIICRMDAHTYFPPDYVAVGVRRLSLGDVANVSGPALATGAGGWSDAVALALNTLFGTGGAAFRRSRPVEFEVDTGCAGVWRTETLVTAGGWDEEWVADEDFELAARLRSRGGRLVCVPGMAASYIPRDTLLGLARQYWRYGYYRPMTARRHPLSMRRSQAAPPVLALAATLSAFGPWTSRLAGRAGLGAWLLATLLVAVQAARRGGRRRDAIRLPIVFGVMHYSYGFGFLAGCGRMGIPLTAIRGLIKTPSRPAEPELSTGSGVQSL